MVTINPAKQLGIDNRVGSIEPGKDADLAIYDKHPLSNYAKVDQSLHRWRSCISIAKRISKNVPARRREEGPDRQVEIAG